MRVNWLDYRGRLIQVMAQKPDPADLRRKPDTVWYLVAIALFFTLLAYLLWMPLELRVDSARNLYCLRLGILGRASLEPDPEQGIRLHLRAAFRDFYWGPSDLRKAAAKKSRAGGRTRGRKGRYFTPQKALRLLRSFRIRYFSWDLDTGNPALNARLYPAFYLLDQSLGGFRINFRDHNCLTLQIVSRPLRILRAVV